MAESEILKKFWRKGFLISPSLVELEIEDLDEFMDYLSKLEKKPTVITEEIYKAFKRKKRAIPKVEIKERKIRILKNYEREERKKDINDWVAYYNNRYERIKDLLIQRPELKSALSIGRILKQTGRERVSIIGMVRSCWKSAKGNLVLELEDPSGFIRVVFGKARDSFSRVEEVVPDEVIGVVGTKSGTILWGEKVIFPDIPERRVKRAPEENYAVFTADTHIGSKMFLPKELKRFIRWLRGEIGDERQRKIASKVRYLFVVGDLVDGIGIYPEQEKELEIKDIYKQYKIFAEYFEQIPEEITLIISPGNHDALRIAEPQHALYEDIAEPVYSLPNVVMVSNPAWVNIGSTQEFEGFDVLLYHGYSIDHFVANVPKLRRWGYERADILMEFLLRKRHLAPTHGSTLITPMKEDWLVIDRVPDIFAMAHIHKAKVGKYRGVTNICASCWQGKTTFQEKVGHIPEPARVPVINLRTNEVRILRF
jgi:DNA polymerase II small subunit